MSPVLANIFFTNEPSGKPCFFPYTRSSNQNPVHTSAHKSWQINKQTAKCKLWWNGLSVHCLHAEKIKTSPRPRWIAYFCPWLHPVPSPVAVLQPNPSLNIALKKTKQTPKPDLPLVKMVAALRAFPVVCVDAEVKLWTPSLTVDSKPAHSGPCQEFDTLPPLWHL